jgi:mRNA interferase HigB
LGVGVRVISVKRLREFWEKHTNAEEALKAWYKEAKAADWKAPSDIKDRFASASFLPNSRVVFNVKGNHYRLVAVVRYEFGLVYIRFVGTHAEYDRIDAERI